MNAHERGLVLMWGRTLRRIMAPAVLAGIVDEGADATESVQIDNRDYPLYVITVEHHRGYLAIAEPPTEDHAYLAARELFGVTNDLPHITRVRKVAV